MNLFKLYALGAAVLGFVLCSTQCAVAQPSVDAEPVLIQHTAPSTPLRLQWSDEVFLSSRQSESILPLAGYTLQLDINTFDDGHWLIDQQSGWKVWQLDITPAELEHMSLYFSVFDLGLHGQFFVLDSDNQVVAGAFTHLSNSDGGSFAIGLLPAKAMRLHFQTAVDAADYELNLSEIGLLKSPKSAQGFGNSGACEVNVNCSEGLGWQRQKRGVARIVVKQGSALYYCSGSLVNNTLQDKTPYFLTANHCGSNATATDYAQWIFAFNYEAAGCERPDSEPVSQSMTGATLIAHASGGTAGGSDFKLLRFLQEVPQAYNPYFNGWSRSGNPPSAGVGIHHPEGDIKKISTYTTPLQSSDYGANVSNPSGKYWRMYWSETANGHGVTEGGSSGSPLFDADGRIVGALTGGSSSCNDRQEPDYYGKFSYSWASNGTEASDQLAPWLDPLQSGLQMLGGLGSDTMFVEADFEASRTELSINQIITFENLSSGKVGSYAWTFEGGTPASSTQKDPGTVTYYGYGNFDVRLIVSNETTADTLLREDYISVKPFLYPNPASHSFTLAFGTDITADVQLDVYDALGREVAFFADIQTSAIGITLQHPNRGAYVVVIRDKSIEKTLKFSIVR